MDTNQCGVLHPNEKVAHWINNGIGSNIRNTDAQQHAMQAQSYKDLIGELFKSNSSHSHSSAASFDQQGRPDQMRTK
ncbi:uncharacterized protein N7484_010921 [Penicillium longicatenatum]|uniref:uncharacterized protein n=1 Tax=Penicillium longicatenatum TaxID=1561947 RepID=UPI0025495F19|nr:uncharacterized protein N7484_010921 [Penicillium longicatenatum]KAJ5630821.1 hypothetical protein N7484_010921 [Penicillium longicatenatum]KAJ5659999.1 hypothetical protein N7507_006450 [Penicillium longicatenatum]